MNVAVVIPTYDRASMVVEAVESALGQTEACRVVVVDDGSTDDTLDRLEAFGPAIDVLVQPNRERGAARNAGAARAPDADLLVFLDADDRLRPDHVETVAGLARAHPEASLVTTRAALVDTGGGSLGELGNSRPGPVALEAFLLGRETVPQGATAFRREAFEAVGGFDERRALSGSEDWLLVARALTRARGHRGAAVTAVIRRHPGSSMADAESMERSMLMAHRLYFDGEAPSRHVEREGAGEPGAPAPPAEVEALRDRSRAALLVQAATGHYGAGATGRARRALKEAVRADVSVALDPLWGWTWARSLLGPGVSGALRRLKRALRR